MASGNEQTLCAKCGIRVATNFVCGPDKGKSVAWCDECLEAEDPSRASFAAEVKKARCRYCGGYPCSGGTDIFPLPKGTPPEPRWMCMSCAMEYYSHVQVALAGIAGAHVTAVKQMERLHGVERDAERHMRDFVRMRDN